MWRFENNILYAPNGTTWPARSGGLSASSEVENHKRTDDGRWMPIPHDNSLYKTGNKLYNIKYKIKAPYGAYNVLDRDDALKEEFIRDISDKNHAFCKDYNDSGVFHNARPGHKDCIRFEDCLAPNFEMTLTRLMKSNHTWFVPLRPLKGQDMGRSGFGIHPDGGEPGTQGCIGVIADDTSALLELLKRSYDDVLEVIASTPWWMHNPSL